MVCVEFLMEMNSVKNNTKCFHILCCSSPFVNAVNMFYMTYFGITYWSTYCEMGVQESPKLKKQLFPFEIAALTTQIMVN